MLRSWCGRAFKGTFARPLFFLMSVRQVAAGSADKERIDGLMEAAEATGSFKWVDVTSTSPPKPHNVSSALKHKLWLRAWHTDIHFAGPRSLGRPRRPGSLWRSTGRRCGTS